MSYLEDEMENINLPDLVPHFKKTLENKGGWTGPDVMHSSIAAGCGTPSTNLDKEGLEYHMERDRDLLYVVLLTAMQMGYSKGRYEAEKVARKEEERYERWQEADKEIINSLREELRKYRPDPVVSPEARNEVVQRMLNVLRAGREDK